MGEKSPVGRHVKGGKSSSYARLMPTDATRFHPTGLAATSAMTSRHMQCIVWPEVPGSVLAVGIIIGTIYPNLDTWDPEMFRGLQMFVWDAYHDDGNHNLEAANTGIRRILSSRGYVCGKMPIMDRGDKTEP